MTTVDTSQFEYKDMFGRDIKVGDYIVYAGLADRSAVMRAGRVVELTYTKAKYSSVEPKIRVASWNNFRANDRNWKDPNKKTSGRQKDVVLGFLDRLIVVDASTVSDQVKNDLAGPVADYWGNIPE